MTGTGAQDNPYIVETWDEFVTAIGESGAYSEFPLIKRPTEDTTVQRGKLYYDAQGNLIEHPTAAGLTSYYENGFEIDLNDVYPEGVPDASSSSPSAAVVVRGKFNGRGGTIRNLYSNALKYCFDYISAANWVPEIINTDILNLYFIGIDSGSAIIHTPSTNETCLLRSDRISGVFYNSAFYSYAGRGVMFERCAVSMHVNARSFYLFLGPSLSTAGQIFKNSIFDISGAFNGISGDANDTGFQIGASNSLITGHWNIPHAQYEVINQFQSSVIDVECTAAITIQFNSISVPSVINTDKMPNVSFIAGSTGVLDNLIQANNSQISNAGWLLDHGFPVGRMS